MTLEELAKRVFAAEQKVMSANGADIHRSELVLAPDDYVDIITVERVNPDQTHWVEFDYETGRHKFRGHPMRMDNDLKTGDVRLRTEVFA